MKQSRAAKPKTKAHPPPPRREPRRRTRNAEAGEETLRQCIVTRERYPKEVMIRFVLAPDATLTPDLSAKLPGRGAWVLADRAALEQGIRKHAFDRALDGKAEVLPDLAERIEAQLVRRCLDLLGQALGAGRLVLGASAVQRAARDGAAAVLVIAADAAPDSRRKSLAALKAGSFAGEGQRHHTAPMVIGCFTSAELSLALGRENVVHAALPEGGLGVRLKTEARRLEGFRALIPDDWAQGGKAA
jgi:predicted RNA-binding protein YlxR (DUF448 family)